MSSGTPMCRSGAPASRPFCFMVRTTVLQAAALRLEQVTTATLSARLNTRLELSQKVRAGFLDKDLGAALPVQIARFQQIHMVRVLQGEGYVLFAKQNGQTGLGA